jgi:hypothetical protein
VAEHIVSDLYIHPQHRRWAFDVTGGPAVVAAVRHVDGVIHFVGGTFFVKASRDSHSVYNAVLRAVEQIGA